MNAEPRQMPDTVPPQLESVWEEVEAECDALNGAMETLTPDVEEARQKLDSLAAELNVKTTRLSELRVFQDKIENSPLAPTPAE